MEAGGRGGGAVSAGHKIGREEFVGGEEYSNTLEYAQYPIPLTNVVVTFGPVGNLASRAAQHRRWDRYHSDIRHCSYRNRKRFDIVCSMDGVNDVCKATKARICNSA